jgi:hypothetical protein
LTPDDRLASAVEGQRRHAGAAQLLSARADLAQIGFEPEPAERGPDARRATDHRSASLGSYDRKPANSHRERGETGRVRVEISTHEFDTLIAPVVEEVVVVRRKLVRKEEVHLRLVRATEQQEQHRESVTLRRQHAVIERIPVEQPSPAGEGHSAEH